MSQQVLSITQVNEYVRVMMDRDPLLASVAVRGEVSNYKLYPSGHHYFTLKDENAALKCVLFRSSASRMKVKLENGMKIIAAGRISVYPRDGAYQLYCNIITLDGIGDLHAAFEQLKSKLAAQGLFDESHKKPIPKYPQRIGIITSSAGAAIHDMLRIINKRYPMVKVLLLPVRVQGSEAPGEIVAAIRYANQYQLADVLIVGRGGGSIEDLWAFNDEQVAFAIYHSAIPIISAVGHEPDVTISDYVADLRAATPSNAAELVVPDRDALQQWLDNMTSVMIASLNRQLTGARRHINMLALSQVLQSPMFYFKRKREDISLMSDRLINAHKELIGANRNRFICSTSKLDAMSPLKVLSRGYAMARVDTGEVLTSVKAVKQGDRLRIQVIDGIIQSVVSGVEEEL